MEASGSSSGEPELRIVLVGKAGGGKSATGNTILGEEKFDSRFEFEPVTQTCRREVRAEPWKGRRVVVIDTPAVFDGHAKEPQKSREIQQCLSLAKPDPFALVFVTQVGRFTKEDVETLKQVEKTFGKGAMKNMIVLFTRQEDLAPRSLEEFIQQSDNKALRDLVKKCQNRCCAFSNKAGGAKRAAQAEELLSKVGRMMLETVGGSFPEQPKGKAARQDSHGAKMETGEPAGGWRAPEIPSRSPDKPELWILLVGKTGGGKSATGNTILGEEKFESRLEFQPVTKTCIAQVRANAWKGKRVIVIDTPAIFEDPWSHQEIQKCLYVAASGPYALVFVTQVGRFTQEDVLAVKRVETIFGEEAMENMVVLFTRKEDLGTRSLRQFTEQSDNAALRELVRKCENRCCAFDNKAKGAERAVQGEMLLAMLEKLVQPRENPRSLEPLPKKTGGKAARGQSPEDAMETEDSARGQEEPGSIRRSSSEEPELRIVLVGKTGGGKSATGNTILGEKKFDSRLEFQPVTQTCRKVVRAKDWKGKRVAVIDTPALFEEPQSSWEIQNCLSLAGPGPYALVFVTQVGRFTQEDVTAAKQVEIIFGEEAMKNMIVLFTRKEDLGTRTLEQFTEQSDNPALRELVRKCENRCCAFDNKAKGAERAVQGEMLLAMIEKMVQEHWGIQHWERLSRNPTAKVAGGNCQEEEMDTEDLARGLALKEPKGPATSSYIRERPVSSQEPRKISCSLDEPERRIVLVGRARGGRSATGNTVLGEEKFESRPDFQAVTQTCSREVRAEEWKGKHVVVIDTPAICEEPHNLREIQKCISLAEPGPHAFVFVTQVGRFTQDDAMAVKQVAKIFGQECWKNMIVLFTHKEDLGLRSPEDYVRNTGNRFLQDLVQKCEARCCAFNNKVTGAERALQAEELLSKIEKMLQQNRG